MSSQEYYGRPPTQERQRYYPPPQQPYRQSSNPPTPQNMNQGYYQQPGGYGQPPPQGQYPPPQGGPAYGGPPPAGYHQPPPGPYPNQQAYQSNQMAPPPQGHSPYPQQQSPYPSQPLPPQGHSPYPPQPAGYPPPPGQYGGYPPHNSTPQADADLLRKAMKGFGTNEDQLINVLASVPNAAYMAQVRQNYQSMHRRDLISDLRSETSGNFREGLSALARGPAEQDAHLVHRAIKGAGTDEAALNEVLLGRPPEAIDALKAEYNRLYHSSLERDVSADLSFETKKLFATVLMTRRHPEGGMIPPQVANDEASALWQATELSKDPQKVTQVLTTYSNGELRSIAQEFQRFSKGTPLDKVVKRVFSGHMKEAYLQILERAMDPAKADADALEAAMRGIGTENENLLNRLVRMHWDWENFKQVKRAYKHFYHRDLVARVDGETSKDFGKLLVKICAKRQGDSE